MAYATTTPVAVMDSISDLDINEPHLRSQPPPAGARRRPEAATALGGMLQTTLDLTEIVTIFAEHIHARSAFDHFEYRHTQFDIALDFGQPAPHSCRYRLMVEGEYQGEVTIRRHTPFNVEEQALLEELLAELVYPLRNALLYKAALQAAQKDALTGIGNRAAFDNTLAREIELAKRHDTLLSLIAIDIDHFKRINDSYGHSVGDQVIRAVAQNASATIRSCDMLFRYGGEEFVILLSNTDTNGAMLLAQRLRQRIADDVIHHDATPVAVTISAGVATATAEDTPESLFVAADNALYQAKHMGRNRCCTHRHGSRCV